MHTRKQLRAPWRIDFITAPKEPGCFICKKSKSQSKKGMLKNHVVAFGKTCYILLNDYPYSSGHLMVCPIRHLSELEDLTLEERAELMELTIRAKNILTKVMKPQGFNIGLNLGDAAGAGHKIHLHQHIVPRWNGDANFTTTIADIRVLPESLEVTTKKLIEAYQNEYEN
ncbi:MAG: HIT domain-containing protein [Lentisphaeria bacterium]|nr:HIT domain-containing protein [Lentisphaeria bacterium]